MNAYLNNVKGMLNLKHGPEWITEYTLANTSYATTEISFKKLLLTLRKNQFVHASEMIEL